VGGYIAWKKYADVVCEWSKTKLRELYRESKKTEESTRPPQENGDKPAPSRFASEAQVSRAYAIAKQNDWTNTQFRNLLQSQGVDPHEKPAKVPIIKYGFIIAMVQKADNAAKYTE
jgi:hypothetical protein